MNTTTAPMNNAIPNGADNADTPAWMPLAGRIGLSAIFILSGVSKLAAPAATIGYIESVGIGLAPLALSLAILVEVIGGVMLVLGYRIRVIAALLAMFSLATALIFHSDLADQNQFIHFFKNVAMAGGLIQVAAFGGGRLTLGARR